MPSRPEGTTSRTTVRRVPQRLADLDTTVDSVSYPRLLLPALRGRIGDWAYYVCLMDLREVASRVRFARELHRSDRLSDIIQRGMSDHAGRIAQYLLVQQQRFLNSLVVAVYGGEPQFQEMSVRQTVPSTMGKVPELVEMNMGVLVLRGDERLMALDGQHRVRGIQLALESKPALGDEQVGVIFLGHASGTAGLQRTRRLFTTLNAYPGESDQSVRSFRSPRPEAAERPTLGRGSPPDDHLLSGCCG